MEKKKAEHFQTKVCALADAKILVGSYLTEANWLLLKMLILSMCHAPRLQSVRSSEQRRLYVMALIRHDVT
jgi:hypothetical protein